MHGGDQSPAINSPYNKYRKQMSFGSPSTGPFYIYICVLSQFLTSLAGGARKTPSKSNSLAKKAITNRAESMSEDKASISPGVRPGPHGNGDTSPMRPEQLDYGAEKSPKVLKKMESSPPPPPDTIPDSP